MQVQERSSGVTPAAHGSHGIEAVQSRTNQCHPSLCPMLSKDRISWKPTEN